MQIPIWVVFRSGLSPCNIYERVNGKFQLILHFDTPIPRIWIGKMMRSGTQWLYVHEDAAQTFSEYLNLFLNDRFVEEFIDDLVASGLESQLVFPRATKIPKFLLEKFNIKQNIEFEHGELETTDFGLIHISAARLREQHEHVQSVTSSESHLIEAKNGDDVDFENLIGEMESIELSLEVKSKGSSDSESVSDDKHIPGASLDYSVDLSAKLLKERDLYFEESKLLRQDKQELKQEKDALETQNKKLNEQISGLQQKYDNICEKFDIFRSRKNEAEGTLQDQSMSQKIGKLEERAVALREENVQTKMTLGKAKTVIQDFARQVRVRDSKIEQLTLRVSQLSKSPR